MLVDAKLYVFCEYEMNESIMVAEYSRENHSANQITAKHISAAVILLRSAMNCKKAAEFDAILFQESWKGGTERPIFNCNLTSVSSQ